MSGKSPFFFSRIQTEKYEWRSDLSLSEIYKQKWIPTSFSLFHISDIVVHVSICSLPEDKTALLYGFCSPQTRISEMNFPSNANDIIN